MMPRTHTSSCGPAAENPKRQAPWPLPVLWATDELSGGPEVLSGCPEYLAQVAQSPLSWAADVMAEILCHPRTAPAVVTPDHPSPGQGGESRLRNSLREICTARSVRGETPMAPW